MGNLSVHECSRRGEEVIINHKPYLKNRDGKWCRSFGGIDGYTLVELHPEHHEAIEVVVELRHELDALLIMRTRSE